MNRRHDGHWIWLACALVAATLPLHVAINGGFFHAHLDASGFEVQQHGNLGAHQHVPRGHTFSTAAEQSTARDNDPLSADTSRTAGDTPESGRHSHAHPHDAAPPHHHDPSSAQLHPPSPEAPTPAATPENETPPAEPVPPESDHASDSDGASDPGKVPVVQKDTSSKSSQARGFLWLTAIDSERQEMTSYSNPAGQPANAVTDTDAFATCP